MLNWIPTWPETRAIELPILPWMPSVCSNATFDGGPDDPRALVHRFQQSMRAELLPRVARPSLWRRALATCDFGRGRV